MPCGSHYVYSVAAIFAGAAPEIVEVFFGSAFIRAGSLLSLLILGGIANVMFTVALTVMTADGHPARTVFFTAPFIPLALAGHLAMIPRFGQFGAALVTVGVSLLSAFVAVASISVPWKVRPPLGTFLRSLVICAGSRDSGDAVADSWAIRVHEFNCAWDGWFLELLVDWGVLQRGNCSSSFVTAAEVKRSKGCLRPCLG